MIRIEQLKKWIEDELMRFGSVGDCVEVVTDEGTSSDLATVAEYRVRLYTETHRYSIVARARTKGKDYLGCVVSCRTPRAGEDWTRGNDLADGDLCRDTWERIKNDMISYELIKIVKQEKPKYVPPKVNRDGEQN